MRRDTSNPLPVASQVLIVAGSGGAVGCRTVRVVQQVEALAQRLSLRRQPFRALLAVAAAPNDAQTRWTGVRRSPPRRRWCTGTGVSCLRWPPMTSATTSRGAGTRSSTRTRHGSHWCCTLCGRALLPASAEVWSAVFRQAQYYNLEGLCRAAQSPQEQVIAMGRSGHTRTQYSHEVYDALQGSRKPVDVGMGALPALSRFCAGDRRLFALQMPADECAGSVSRFCPALHGWALERRWVSVPDVPRPAFGMAAVARRRGNCSSFGVTTAMPTNPFLRCSRTIRGTAAPRSQNGQGHHTFRTRSGKRS